MGIWMRAFAGMARGRLGRSGDGPDAGGSAKTD